MLADDVVGTGPVGKEVGENSIMAFVHMHLFLFLFVFMCGYGCSCEWCMCNPEVNLGNIIYFTFLFLFFV